MSRKALLDLHWLYRRYCWQTSPANQNPRRRTWRDDRRGMG